MKSDEMIVEGLLVNDGTSLHPRFLLTDRGYAIAAEFRRFRSEGGNTADFTPVSQ